MITAVMVNTDDLDTGYCICYMGIKNNVMMDPPADDTVGGFFI